VKQLVRIIQITEYEVDAKDEMKALDSASKKWADSDRGAMPVKGQIGKNAVRVLVNPPTRKEEQDAVALVLTVLAHSDHDDIEQGMDVDLDALDKAAEIVGGLA